MRSTIGAVLFLLLANFAFAQAKPQQAPAYSVAKPKTSNEQSAESSRLPVKRVVLYKNGVGYFEHSARVHGDQELGIDFTTAQLNDVLKSLTVVDLGDGRISGVRYNSIAPLGERLKALRLPFRRAGFPHGFPDRPPGGTSRGAEQGRNCYWAVAERGTTRADYRFRHHVSGDSVFGADRFR